MPLYVIVNDMKVLLAIDGSAISKVAMRRLPDLVNLAGASVVVLTIAPNPVMPDVTGMMGPPYVDFTLLAQQVKAEAEQHLAEADEYLRGRGLEAKLVFRQGDPGGEILDFIRQEGIELAVLGSHGRTGFRKLLLGSVSSRVVNEAPCPVLVVKDSSLKEE